MTRTVTTLPYTEMEVATGNYDTTRTTIDRIVIHTMVGTVESAAQRFDTYGTQVSAHYGVKLDGSLIHWLEETSTAYHAGSYSMNQRSIGIEHEDNGDYNGIRPDVLYTESAKLVHDICTFWEIPIDREHIIKHSEVIPTGCPDALDIDRIVREAQALDTVMATISQADLDALRKARDDNWNLHLEDEKQNAALQNQLTVLQTEYDQYKKDHPDSTVTIQVPVPVIDTQAVSTSASSGVAQAATNHISEQSTQNQALLHPFDAKTNNTGGLGAWIARLIHSIFG